MFEEVKEKQLKVVTAPLEVHCYTNWFFPAYIGTNSWFDEFDHHHQSILPLQFYTKKDTTQAPTTIVIRDLL